MTLLSGTRKTIKHFLRKPEKIICVGLGKTGTTSFGEAMKILNYNHCFVGSVGVAFGHENRVMLPIYRTLRKFDSFDDFPWPFLYEQVYVKYPRAKFVLTRRKSAEAWLKSLQKHYCVSGPTWDQKAYFGYFSPFENPKHHLSLYERHNERVREYFKGCPNFVELCWEEGHGWPELCGFLGKRIPKVPFPRSNAAQSIDYDEARKKADAKLSQYLR